MQLSVDKYLDRNDKKTEKYTRRMTQFDNVMCQFLQNPPIPDLTNGKLKFSGTLIPAVRPEPIAKSQ